ncbi:MAG: threonylcarbamoyl-AMP synthase [Acidobacteria bacterium]|nr:threonylcarbamoyl-AMP synthase [Acidobacteriota bacterium]
MAFMKTFLTSDPIEAAEFIRSGGIVAFPTETVFGLGANAFDDGAVKKIFTAKGRPSDNPLIVHVVSTDQINEIVTVLSDHAKVFMEIFFPGPLTIVAASSGKISPIAAAGLDTVAFRMPAGKLAQELIKAAGAPLVAPSANVSGRPSPTTWQAVLEDMDGKIDCVLKGEPTTIGLESTVIDCTGSVPVMLRAGAISLEELRKAVSETVDGTGSANVRPKSPGTKHRHYSPRAMVKFIEDGDVEENIARSAYIGMLHPKGNYEKVKIVGSVEEYARELFEFFRECDRSGVEVIYCQSVSNVGVGAALMDRIRRASE